MPQTQTFTVRDLFTEKKFRTEAELPALTAWSFIVSVEWEFVAFDVPPENIPCPESRIERIRTQSGEALKIFVFQGVAGGPECFADRQRLAIFD
jgi:hypothetical protein